MELPNKEVLFLKKFQNNNFFPLEKAVRTPIGWNVFPHKHDGWSQNCLFYTDERFLFMLKNNLYLVTDYPMKDDNEFNFN